ncbi:SLATT domain-containing protein [Thiothrix eikelboomii]|uniref:SLATT domain-containing protein n=1 Tax=Thiothrix eikelboomii TaxID=92487 RepID=UPI003BAFB558
MHDIVKKMIDEALRIEEDCTYSSKGQFNSGDIWGKWHLRLGLPAAVITALAGASAFADQALLAGIAASIATALTTTLTFLRPSERAETHKAAGASYLTLRNQARIFREIELESAAEHDLTALKKRLLELAMKKDELNQTMPGILRQAYELARKDIEEGRHKHNVDIHE